MLIPSIDLMGGKIVQLVQGANKALEFDDFEPWVQRFSSYSLVQIIDLDAAMGQGNNQEMVRQLARRLPCQVGGGIRSRARAEEVLADGAQRVIIGSALVKNGTIDTAFAQQLAADLGPERLVFAIDSRDGRVATHGWKTDTAISPLEMIAALQPYCGAFLYTHIDTEGLMQGIPIEVVARLRDASSRRLIVAGGIASAEEVQRLDEMGVDAVVGMAVYLGKV